MEDTHYIGFHQWLIYNPNIVKKIRELKKNREYEQIEIDLIEWGLMSDNGKTYLLTMVKIHLFSLIGGFYR